MPVPPERLLATAPPERLLAPALLPAAPPERPLASAPAPRPAATGRLNVPAADGIRGLAALAVVLYHVMYAAGTPSVGTPWLRNIVLSGYMGADFFFVLSGFLLFLPVAQSLGRFGSVRAYSGRRAARILPAYYLAVLASWALYPVLKGAHPTLSPNTGPLSVLLHLTFLQHSLGLALNYGEGFAVNGALWTLAIEVVFYVGLPLVAAWYFRRPFVGLAIAVAAAWLWMAAAASGRIPLPAMAGFKVPVIAHLIVITQFPAYLGHFAVGMTAAYIFVKVRRGDLKLPSWAPVVAQFLAFGALIAAMEVLGEQTALGKPGPLGHWTTNLPVAFLFALVLLATALAPRWAQRGALFAPVRRLGEVSYGLYLSHLVLLDVGVSILHLHTGTNADYARWILLCLGGGLVVGHLSYYLMERPILRWARNRSRERERVQEILRRLPMTAEAQARHLPAPAPGSSAGALKTQLVSWLMAR